MLQDGLLYHLDLPRQRKKIAAETVTRQLVLPQSLQELILSSYHDDSCHINSEKLYNIIRQKYYWPNLYVDSFNWARTCSARQRSKGNVINKAPLNLTSTSAQYYL